MTADRLGRSRGWVSAIVLAAGAALLAWLCVRSAVVAALPTSSTVRVRLAGTGADTVLTDAMTALVAQRGGMLPPAMLAAVRQAAQTAPLDARPFLILGQQQLIDKQLQSGIKALEVSQRLDPRNRLVHLLLLDSYLKVGRYADVAAQFAVATRLVGQAREPIAAALAQMIKTPEMHEAALGALRADPALEKSVLATLARSDTDPATLFSLASPAARRDAGAIGSWGSILVNRMVVEGGYVTARSVWQKVHGLSDTQVAPLVYDGNFRGLPGGTPFNWTLIAGGLGAADIFHGGLSINYYGRDTGELASQLVVLTPGTYELAFAAEGSKAGEGPSLVWSLRCDMDGTVDLLELPVVAGGEQRRNGARFTVPPGCPAQRLVISGIAGDFPAPINITLRDLSIRRVDGTTR